MNPVPVRPSHPPAAILPAPAPLPCEVPACTAGSSQAAAVRDSYRLAAAQDPHARARGRNGLALAPPPPRREGDPPLRPPAPAVGGPMGRMFNRILGQPESRTDSGGLGFDRGQLKDYLKRIGMAEDWWVGRDSILTRSADKLMAALDTDGDGKVGWSEFKRFEGQILQVLAPGALPDAAVDALREAAAKSFAPLDNSPGDGNITMKELREKIRSALPKDTPYIDVVAELGARLILDAIDTDERDKKLADVRLSKEEWFKAAEELAKKEPQPEAPVPPQAPDKGAEPKQPEAPVPPQAPDKSAEPKPEGDGKAELEKLQAEFEKLRTRSKATFQELLRRSKQSLKESLDGIKAKLQD